MRRPRRRHTLALRCRDIRQYMHCGESVLFARIVDYGGHLRPRHYFDDAIENMLNNFNSFGFTVDTDLSQQQPPGPTCGVVAVAAAARLSFADWRTANVASAAHPSLVQQACAALDLPHITKPLTRSHLHKLYSAHPHIRASPSDLRVLAYDELWQQVSRDVVTCASVKSVLVVNDQPRCMRGAHWFTVAYTVQYA